MPKDQIKDVADGKLVIATTGAQGEPMAGLARMANRDHRFVEIQPGDTVIVSAPARSRATRNTSPRTIDNLFKAGANVFYHTIKRAHVSGHASQEELKLMLGLTKPKLLHPDPRRVPDAGPARPPGDRDRRRAGQRVHHRERHADRDLRRTARPVAASPCPAGYVFVDGLSVGEVGEIVLRDRRALANDGMFMIVVPVDKQTGDVVGRPEIITRGFVHGNEEDPIIEGAIERIVEALDQPGRPHQRDRPAQDADQGRRLALPVRADEAPPDGLPGRRRGLADGDASTHRRLPHPSSRRSQASKSPSRGASPAAKLSSGCQPAVVRSLVGIVLLVLGAVTLIALLLPGQGPLTDCGATSIAPWFGTGRWLLPFVLLAVRLVRRAGPGKEPARRGGARCWASAMSYVGILGLIQLVEFSGEFTGGRIGRFLSGLLEPLLTHAGRVRRPHRAHDRRAADRLRHAASRAHVTRDARGRRRRRTTLQDRTARAADTVVAAKSADAKGAEVAAAAVGVGVMAEPGRKGRHRRFPRSTPRARRVSGAPTTAATAFPYGVQNPPPTSATIAPLRMPGGAAAPAMAVAATALRDPADVTDAADSPARREAIAWVLPPIELLDLNELPTAAAGATADADARAEQARIIEKLQAASTSTPGSSAATPARW